MQNVIAKRKNAGDNVESGDWKALCLGWLSDGRNRAVPPWRLGKRNSYIANYFILLATFEGPSLRRYQAYL